MTEKRWNQLTRIRGTKHITCHHPDGNFCTAYKNGRCIALYNTHFMNKDCPFFRDTRGMTGAELLEYYDFIDSLTVTDRSYE